MNLPIGVGVKVRLKSGGPAMTVIRRPEDGNEWVVRSRDVLWLCRWFQGDQLREETFPAGALEPC